MTAGLLVALLATPAVAGPHARRARVTKVATAAPAHPSAAARTLDDIHIEGEIPVPQVLFITARDQRRFLEFQNRRYLRTSRKIGEDTVLPSRIVVTGARPTPDQEISR
jgi:hypothetical protein